MTKWQNTNKENQILHSKPLSGGINVSLPSSSAPDCPVEQRPSISTPQTKWRHAESESSDNRESIEPQKRAKVCKICLEYKTMTELTSLGDDWHPRVPVKWERPIQSHTESISERQRAYILPWGILHARRACQWIQWCGTSSTSEKWSCNCEFTPWPHMESDCPLIHICVSQLRCHLAHNNLTSTHEHHALKSGLQSIFHCSQDQGKKKKKNLHSLARPLMRTQGCCTMTAKASWSLGFYMSPTSGKHHFYKCLWLSRNS